MADMLNPIPLEKDDNAETVADKIEKILKKQMPMNQRKN
jgi:hypothetical protein